MTVITKPIDKKAKQNQVAMAVKALANKGIALAKICSDYARGIALEEEKRGNKQKSIAKSIAELTPEGHKAFRAELNEELGMLNDVEKKSQFEDSRIKGYSSNSFRVMLSNYKSISVACELGLKVTNKDGEVKKWVEILSEAVAFKHANATSETPTIKPGRGRKAKAVATPYDKAINAMNALDDGQFAKFAAVVAAKLATMKASNSSRKPAVKREAALV